jgi:lipopolysaccharide/colanic/teichoic acid biosynthesis glycosyltransferase
MPFNTKSTSTHLIKNVRMNPFSIFLRETGLDEIPQLWNVLIGEMSLVGPRPCLISQRKLIKERKKRGIFKARPGLTGLAQVKGINMAQPTLLAKTELKMIKQLNFFYYFYYIFITILLIFKRRP